MRLAAIAASGLGTARFGDSAAYLAAAKSLVETGRYPDATDFRFFFRPPAYPIFLVAATLGHPDCIVCAQIANAVLGALAPLLLAVVSARLFRSRGLAVVTGFAAALHPSFVVVSADVQSEALFLLLLLAAGFLLLAASDRPSSNLALLAGACLGLAALTRSTALALAPLLAASLGDRRYPLRARAHLAASALLGLVLTLAPWTLRNAIVYRELILSSDAGGLSFFHGNSIWTRRYYALRTKEEYLRWQVDLDRDMRRRFAELEHGRRLSPGERSGGFARMAFAQIKADPAGEARLIARKAWHWVRPWPTPWFWPRPVVVGVGIYYAALFALAAAGLLSAPRRGAALFSVALLLLSMGVHVVLLVVWRYRVPYWDPVLLLYAPYGFVRLTGWGLR